MGIYGLLIFYYLWFFTLIASFIFFSFSIESIRGGYIDLINSYTNYGFFFIITSFYNSF